MSLAAIDTVILCGGQGVRLRTVTENLPKVLVEIDGKPFLERLLDHLGHSGLNRFILSSGYEGQQIEAYFGKRSDRNIVFSREASPLGTAGGLKHAAPHLVSDPFFVLNGDSICNLDFKGLLEAHTREGVLATLVVIPAGSRRDGGFVRVNERSRVLSFEERQHRSGAYLSAGIYIFSKSVLERIPDGERPVSLEREILPSLVEKGLLAYPTQSPLYDIGTPERLRQFQSTWTSFKG